MARKPKLHHPNYILVTHGKEAQVESSQSHSITYSVLISYCFALHPYEKHELIKPEWVIVLKSYNHYEYFSLPSPVL